ncbi:MAG: GyrI-like domain-containing protein, partial [Promethearchaeota archaeon]
QLKINNLKKIEEILLNFKPNELLKMRCTEPVIKKIPKMRVISKRTKGTYGETIPALIGDLMKQIFSKENQEQFVKITGSIMYICHDMEYKEKDAYLNILLRIIIS